MRVTIMASFGFLLHPPPAKRFCRFKNIPTFEHFRASTFRKNTLGGAFVSVSFAHVHQ